MARANNDSGSLRFGRRESARLVAALLLSLLAHLGVWGGYVAGKNLGWWDNLRAYGLRPPAPKAFPLQAQLAHKNEPDPGIFVDVSHADADAPKETKYYSNKNSRAANPDPAAADIPKVMGSQKDVPKTEDAPRPATALPAPPKTDAPKAEPVPQLPKLQPSMPPPQLRPAPTEAVEPPQKPGDLDPFKPKKNPPAPAPAPAAPARPRTLKQAQAQQNQLPGAALQQEGGVPRRTMWSSLDVKSTPFGDYDARHH